MRTRFDVAQEMAAVSHGHLSPYHVKAAVDFADEKVSLTPEQEQALLALDGATIMATEEGCLEPIEVDNWTALVAFHLEETYA